MIFIQFFAFIAVLCFVPATIAASCQEELDSRRQNYAIGGFLPRCDAGNSALYSPLQCHGSVCYCVSSDGTRLSEYSNIPIGTPGNCECAREEDEFRKTGMRGQIFNCAPDGTYSPTRCTGSRCFCVNRDGTRMQEYLEANIWEASECACARAKADYAERRIRGLRFNCERDGSYGAKQCTGSTCRCVKRNGNPIAEFQSFHIAHSSDCGCARAKEDASRSGVKGQPNLSCAQDGSFIQ
ncbi:uncharacterized protein LOC112556664 [Pomacea canaliculata]|uniref:uncharacterized protein LOC112556664 n=1 Tax=Pomacea canaliculata TaxID=400727 RepID=UPI000D7359A2|nr:uncharacterized protein LOC112556664 [Pomacea canaliculata]